MEATQGQAFVWLPKIPQYGPAAQLSPQVLLSKFGELGTGSSSASREPRFKSSSPRGKGSDARQFILPNLGGLTARADVPPTGSGRTKFTSGASGPLSARGYREVAGELYRRSEQGGWRAGLGDNALQGRPHTFLPDLSDFDSGALTDRPSAGPAKGIGGPTAREFSRDVSSMLSPTASQLSLDSPSALPPVVERRPSQGSVTAHGSRQAQLRASFMHDARDIDTALQKLRRWTVKVDTSDQTQEISDPLVEELKEGFDKCFLNQLPPRMNAQNRVPGRFSDDGTIVVEDVAEQDLDAEELATAPRSEIASSIAVLNFLRWLCGLPLVSHDQQRTDVCKVINKVLVPRVSDTSRLYGNPKEFGEHLSKLFLDGGGHASILHGEGSLSVAVERALTATHMLKPPVLQRAGEAGREAMARALVAEHDKSVGHDDLLRQARRGKIQEQPVPILSIQELPPALRDFRLFWELQKLGSDGAGGGGGGAGGGSPKGNGGAAGAAPAGQQPHTPQPKVRPSWATTQSAEASSTRSPMKTLKIPPQPEPTEPHSPQQQQQQQQSPQQVEDSLGQRRRRRQRPMDDLRPVEEDRPSAYGLSSIWGDKRGALCLRRRLLNPALQIFGASRQHDTCVMWTGASSRLFPGTAQKPMTPKATPLTSIEINAMLTHNTSAAEMTRIREARANYRATMKTTRDEAARVHSAQVAKIDAVCYPPTGIVPLFLLEGGTAPWTIMPNSTKYQPTSNIKVRVWRVRIDRPSGNGVANAGGRREWSAERLVEVGVKGFAVDCSLHGEPFCVIFWPDMLMEAKSGHQFEVQLSGLTGVSQELTFFYEFRAFGTRDHDRGLLAEAARLRAMLGDRNLWAQPRISACCQDYPASSVKDNNSSAASTPALAKNRRSLAGGLLPGARSLTNLDDVGWSAKPPMIETMSHHKTQIVTNDVDLEITLRSKGIAALQADLAIIRFGEGEEIVPHGIQVQKLRDDVYFIKVKLPIARCRYEIHFWASRVEAPMEMQKHPFKYMITTGEQCQTLLSSMEDPLLKVFGLARISHEAQHHGIYILAPTTQRILVASCYFLVYVDEARALAHARSQVETRAGFHAPLPRRQESNRLRTAPLAETSESETTLFSKRLLPPDGAGGPHPEVLNMHEVVRSTFEPRTQDGNGDLHLDLTTSRGECRKQLRQRNDFRGFYEAFVTFTDAEAQQGICLQLRFPKIQTAEFAPKTICEWIVCRGEHFPIGF